ncbi:MAG TPA: M48 family metalloprotease [Vicinamibacterales bacterium]|nr:M48 family metalloprotease [Vicinamibacterales bacterium]
MGNKTRAFVCALSLSSGLAIATGCATNPATGEKEFSLMSEAQEIETGRQLDAEVRREMGVYNDPELQRYVERIGQQLAAVSHRPQLQWHFAVVDQPAVNAFALPGGYIYLTRGILPFLDNEAELAGVLGHEIGHVTARHSAQQYSRATGAGLGVTLLSIFVPQARPFQGLTETAFGVLFLRYGREAENQADEFGSQYAAKAGWDPRGVAGMLTTLARLDVASGSRKGVPNWLSTHPAPADRVDKVQAYVAKLAVPGGGDAVRDRGEFLQRVDGLVYGDSPEQGVVRGNRFLHADMRFALTFPRGWDVQNSPQQVVAKAPNADAYVLLQLVPEPKGTLEQVAVGGMQNAGFRPVNGQLTKVNGLEAFVGTYQGNMEGIGNAVVRAAHVVHERRVFLVAGIAPPSVFQQMENELSRAVQSFEPLSREAAANIHPNRIDLYTVRRGDTWEEIAARAGEGLIKPSTLAIMNHHDPDQPPPPGSRIKIVVAG